MNDMKANPLILIVGSTGYLGTNIIELLMSQQVQFKALARNKGKLLSMGVTESQIIEAQVTRPNELIGVFQGVDVVISCLGITRQQDGVGYLDVDYQANLNLLEESERAGVRKFIYISAYNAQKYPHVRLLNCKERFANRLLQTTKLIPCVIRPNGFFSDITEVYNMAKSGRVFTFGDGSIRLNPIHGKDLAIFCLEAIDKTERELDVGGPDVFSVDEIAHLAFVSQNKTEKNMHIPDFLRVFFLKIARCLPERFGGAAEFFLTMLGEDNVAPTYGVHRLEDYFIELSKEEQALH